MSFPDHSSLLGVGPDLKNIEVMLNHSELFRAECKGLIQETDKAWRRMQNDDQKRLDQRVRDIQFLIKELQLKLEEVILETDALITLQSSVVKALEGTKEPLRVTVLCLEERMKRFPAERVEDEVERELLKEQEVLKGVASLLERTVEQMSEQIRLNRSAKYHLEKDLKEKSEAQHIDNSCVVMTTHSIGNLQLSTTKSTSLPSLTVTPKQWENISDINIAKAEHQKTNSESMRALVQSVLEQTAADMQKQFQATTTAFQTHIQEIKSAKSQMEEKLPEILSEIFSQERLREDLQVAITENEHSLNLANTRLAMRLQRPGKEQCYDLAQAQLLTEIQHLTSHIKKLREETTQSQEQQRALVRCKLRMEEDVDMKASSLYIDEVICTQLREPVRIHTF
ncbi:tektin-1 isoform X2 [Haplochromis burtoni]|nr:tektin-1 isoform X2 [Haplochromis burtoni]XP_042072461.1 tektin-1 isoform X2 [Haplochromis burtoni]